MATSSECGAIAAVASSIARLAARSVIPVNA
jgi:hypothetical protein